MDDNQQNGIYVTEDIYLKTATAYYANITLLIQIVFVQSIYGMARLCQM